MHKIELGDRVIKFLHITSVSIIHQIASDDYVILVENEDSIDIWITKHKTRGCNDLVNYYEQMHERQINELDLIVLKPNL